MGYSETSCQICAISLNIARCRLRSEPLDAGWGYSGPDYYSGDPYSSQCDILSDLSGCSTEEGPAPSSETHFPGPLCTYTGGYSGLRIRADEMKGMNFPRYIVRRPDEMDIDGEAPEYEKRSDFFLTAQTVTPQDDFDCGRLDKVRYGVDNLFPQNYQVVEDGDMETGVPVHVACWKIFERLSMMRLGRVELQGFMALWKREPCGYCGFKNLKQDPIIAKCKQQWWDHQVGTEYLAANPYDIPEMLLSLMNAYPEDQLGESVFLASSLPLPHTAQKQTKAPSNPTDTFGNFPNEVQTMILSYLSSKDIGSLRLASRSFRQLPKSLFLELIKKELPWFWEFAELKELYAKYWAKLGHDDDEENQEAAAARLEEERQKTRKVNWLEVYKMLIRLKNSILGIKNRARIWGVTEEIVERIRMLQERLDVDEDDLVPYYLTEAEAEAAPKPGIHDGFDCPRCKIYQING